MGNKVENMKISRQWQLRPGPRHLHHNNMQPAVARMGGGREGREALTEYLEYFLIIFGHVQSWSGRSRNEGEGTRALHYNITIPLRNQTYRFVALESSLKLVSWSLSDTKLPSAGSLFTLSSCAIQVSCCWRYHSYAKTKILWKENTEFTKYLPCFKWTRNYFGRLAL